MLPTDRRSPAASGEEPRYRLFEGTLIDTVLTNRLDGTFTGPVNCLVSVPVYASDQQHVVIPTGSRVLGEARAVNTFGQSRLAVVFHRVILPNGTHVSPHCADTWEIAARRIAKWNAASSARPG